MPSIRIRRRVYYDDTDSGGVVYHTNYLRYMEHARTDFLQRREIAPPVLEAQHGVVFVVADIGIRYRAPARLGEELEIEAALRDAGHSAVRFEQSVWLLNADGARERELASAQVKVVCVNMNTFKPVRIPPPVREIIVREY